MLLFRISSLLANDLAIWARAEAGFLVPHPFFLLQPTVQFKGQHPILCWHGRPSARRKDVIDTMHCSLPRALLGMKVKYKVVALWWYKPICHSPQWSNLARGCLAWLWDSSKTCEGKTFSSASLPLVSLGELGYFLSSWHPVLVSNTSLMTSQWLSWQLRMMP